MELNAELLCRLPEIFILVCSVICAAAVFWLVYRKRQHASKPDRVLTAVAAAAVAFVLAFHAAAILLYVTIGRWCEGCQEFH